MELTFNFSVDETNAILNALGQRPFAEVQQLVSKIHAQAQPQMSQPQMAPPQEPAGVDTETNL